MGHAAERCRQLPDHDGQQTSRVSVCDTLAGDRVDPKPLARSAALVVARSSSEHQPLHAGGIPDLTLNFQACGPRLRVTRHRFCCHADGGELRNKARGVTLLPVSRATLFDHHIQRRLGGNSCIDARGQFRNGSVPNVERDYRRKLVNTIAGRSRFRRRRAVTRKRGCIRVPCSRAARRGQREALSPESRLGLEVSRQRGRNAVLPCRFINQRGDPVRIGLGGTVPLTGASACAAGSSGCSELEARFGCKLRSVGGIRCYGLETVMPLQAVKRE